MPRIRVRPSQSDERTKQQPVAAEHAEGVGSLSAPGYKLVGKPGAPALIAEFEHSFGVVGDLPCDIPLAPHPGMVEFWSRVAAARQGRGDELLDRNGCRAYAQSARKQFAEELAAQGAKPGKAGM